MKEKRFYFDGKISARKTIILEGEEFHHLANVMRAKTGDKVCLFNGDGNFYHGKITQIYKKNAEIYIENIEISVNEPKIQLSIYQALAKGDKLSLVMQKITEIGASELVLFESEYCDVKSNTQKQERMDGISISAAKQCGRATIVQTRGILKIADIANEIKNFDAFYIAYEAEDGKTLANEIIKNKNNLNNIAIMIGAEGGFSNKEIELLKNNGAIIVSLGKRILRTETAAIVCAGLASQILESDL